MILYNHFNIGIHLSSVKVWYLRLREVKILAWGSHSYSVSNQRYKSIPDV